jgi:hypothetical protein
LTNGTLMHSQKKVVATRRNSHSFGYNLEVMAPYT